jgi:hypothetical protein
MDGSPDTVNIERRRSGIHSEIRSGSKIDPVLGCQLWPEVSPNVDRSNISHLAGRPAVVTATISIIVKLKPSRNPDLLTYPS